jgi:hypothetical protein
MVGSTHAVRPPGNGEDMRGYSADAETVQVHALWRVEESLGALAPTPMWSAKIVLAHCPILGHGQKQVRRVFSGDPLRPVAMALEDPDTVKMTIRSEALC